LVEEARRPVDLPDLEKVLQTQQARSITSPGVDAHYYWFLYRLAQTILPKISLELGTHTGISAACLADGNPKGKVLTVNNHAEILEENKRPNIEYFLRDSLDKIEILGGIDILFIDTYHDGIRCRQEYELYEADINPGGVILFDDIHLFDCMNNFWADFTPKRGEKFELPLHGGAGFGVVLI
jgi:predicted O-methyltransferase YrrM